MMECCRTASPQTAISVASLYMNRVSQTFADNTPLHCHICISIEWSTFVCTPTHRAVVDNDIFLSRIRRLIPIHRIIFRFTFISHTTTDKTNDNIVSIDTQCIILQTNSCSWSCLTGNSYIIILYNQLFGQSYNSSHGKHNRTLSGFLNSPT